MRASASDASARLWPHAPDPLRTDRTLPRIQDQDRPLFQRIHAREQRQVSSVRLHRTKSIATCHLVHLNGACTLALHQAATHPCPSRSHCLCTSSRRCRRCPQQSLAQERPPRPTMQGQRPTPELSHRGLPRNAQNTASTLSYQRGKRVIGDKGKVLRAQSRDSFH